MPRAGEELYTGGGAFQVGPGSADYTIPDPEGDYVASDASGWGGRGMAYHTQDGVTYEMPEQGGAEQDVRRFRGMGATSTTAPQVDTRQSDTARVYQTNALGSSADAASVARNAAYGGAPSAAQIYGGQMIDNSVATQMAMANSARGGPTAQAGAGRQAAFQGVQTQQDGARNLAALRADEMAKARGDYIGASSAWGQQAGNMRGQDLGVATYQAGLDDAARTRQQQNQQFYEGMAWNTRRQQQDSANRRYEYDKTGDARDREADRADRAEDYGKVMDVAGMMGGGLGSVGKRGGGGNTSDIRAKENIQSIDSYEARDSGGNSYMPRTWGGPENPGLAFRDDPYGSQPEGTGESAYMPATISDERAKYIYSDDRTKLRAAYVDGMNNAQRTADTGQAQPHPSYLDGETDAGKRARYRGNLQDEWNVGDAAKFAIHPALGIARAAPEWIEAGKQAGHVAGEMGRQAAADFRADPHNDMRTAKPRNQLGAEDFREGARASEDPMASANRAQAGSAYTYKPEFAERSGQAPGEVNVGPMAQNMARDPVAGTAVKKDPSTGMLVLDDDKLQKVQSAGIGSLQRQIDELRARGPTGWRPSRDAQRELNSLQGSGRTPPPTIDYFGENQRESEGRRPALPETRGMRAYETREKR